MKYETWDTGPVIDKLLSTTYYVYTYDATDQARSGKTDGNPTRIITEYPPGGGQQNTALDKSIVAASKTVAGVSAREAESDEGGALLIGGGSECALGQNK